MVLRFAALTIGLAAASSACSTSAVPAPTARASSAAVNTQPVPDAPGVIPLPVPKQPTSATIDADISAVVIGYEAVYDRGLAHPSDPAIARASAAYAVDPELSSFSAYRAELVRDGLVGTGHLRPHPVVLTAGGSSALAVACTRQGQRQIRHAASGVLAENPNTGYELTEYHLVETAGHWRIRYVDLAVGAACPRLTQA